MSTIKQVAINYMRECCVHCVWKDNGDGKDVGKKCEHYMDEKWWVNYFGKGVEVDGKFIPRRKVCGRFNHIIAGVTNSSREKVENGDWE